MWLLTQQGPGHKRDSESARTYSMRSVGRHKRGGEAQDDSGRSVLIWQLLAASAPGWGAPWERPWTALGSLGRGTKDDSIAGPPAETDRRRFQLPCLTQPAKHRRPLAFPMALAFPLAFRRQTVDSLSMLGGPAGPRTAGPAGSGYRPGFLPLAIESQ
jgi:hypothetical protein